MGDTYGLHFIKIGGIWIFRWGRSPLLGGLTIIEKSWNYGNLAYLVANRPTYDLNFIKIRYIWFFGGRSALLGGLTKIERSWNYGNLPHLVANTYGLNFIKIRNNWVIGAGGWDRNPLLEGVTFDLWYPFSNSAELFQSKVMCENFVQIGWDFQELSW